MRYPMPAGACPRARPHKRSVPFCRAANGALARRRAALSLYAMTMHRVVSRWIIRLRAQRRSREVLLAVAITIAAVVFIAAAIGRADRRVQGHPVQTKALQAAPAGGDAAGSEH